MWNEILGALTILGMILVGVVLIPAAPKLVDAVCDRIRYGIQNAVDGLGEDQEEEAPAAPAPKTATKPVAATTAKTTAAKPAAARTAA